MIVRMNRRTFIKVATAGAIAAGIPAYARVYEPNAIRVVRHQIRVLGLHETLRIGQLSDLHVTDDASLRRVEKALSLVLSTSPQALFLTGDFITGKTKASGRYVDILRRASSSLPVFASLGNHDGGPWSEQHGGWTSSTEVESLLTDGGVRLLLDQGVVAEIGSTRIRIVGLRDIWNAQPTFPEHHSPERLPTLVLAHNPDSKDLIATQTWDVMFSGHTHGGQVVVPFLGWRPFVPVRDTRFVDGAYAWAGHHIVVSRGVGNLHGLRFNCPPDVRVVDLLQA